MKKLMILLLLPLLFGDCRSKKMKLADDDTIEINDFIDFFPESKLPFQFSDSLIKKKETDSTFIGYKIFTQFIPDTVLAKQFGKEAHPKIYPLGKAAMKKADTYLFVKAVSAEKRVGYVIAFNKENKFVASMPAIVLDKDPATSQVSTMDSKFSLTVLSQKKNADGMLDESKNVYILNSDAQMFSLILTDAGSQQGEQDIINPIDTFPRKHAFAGDYIKDKRNYISIRDGRNSSELAFFTHFEKENGECTGELKGTAKINSAKTALFRANGNPCVLEFSFSGNTISLREVEACGSYRDIKCFFDGKYSKKKEVKPKKTTRKK